jgi:DNA-binding transcriptional MerR regulator
MLRIGDFSRLAQVTIKTLRYYDEVGLLRPAAVDRFTGYRTYTLDQLPRLNRILVLKDFGLSLEQIAHLLEDDLRMGDMLRSKQAALRQHIEDEQARLARIELRLRQLEDNMPNHEVIVKHIEPQQVLTIRRILPDGAGIRPMIDEVKAALRQHHIRSNGPVMALYHHAGYRDHDLDIEVAVPVETSPSRTIILSAGLPMSLRTIPAVTMAVSVLLQGGYEGIGGAYQALDTYLHEHGHQYLGPAREVYLRGAGDTNIPAEYLTEVQYPVGVFTRETVLDGVDVPSDWNEGDASKLPFSRRARTALEFAKLEAAVLHEVTPLLLLLGMLRDNQGFAAHVLGDLGITAEQIRGLVSQGEIRSGGPVVAASARQVIAYADLEARQLGHDYIGTEHLLLGLLRQADASVIHLLAEAGVTPEQVRTAVLEMFNS